MGCRGIFGNLIEIFRLIRDFNEFFRDFNGFQWISMDFLGIFGYFIEIYRLFRDFTEIFMEF